MKNLSVNIELNGQPCFVGTISGTSENAHFKYDSSYLSEKSHSAISLSLPLQEMEFSAMQTRNFFEGLLPEFKPIGNAPSTHIVKQSHVRLEGIVANETLCLLAAKLLGISVPENFILNCQGLSENEFLFATKRYDRFFSDSSKTIEGMKVPFRLHQEDFSQSLGIPASKKYEEKGDSHLKKIFELLRSYSSDPISDQLKLWDMLVFDYFIGNTDAHIKNFSLLYSPESERNSL